MMFFFLLLATVSANAESEKIFVVHSYPPNSWTKGLDDGIRSEAKKLKYDIETYHYHSDFWATKSADAKRTELNRIISLASNPKFKGFIVADDEASELLRDSIVKFKKPVVFTGINHHRNSVDAQRYCGKEPMTSALLEEYPFKAAFQQLTEINPKIEKIALFASVAPTSETYINGLKAELEKNLNKFEIIKDMRSADWEQWKLQLIDVQSKVDLIWIFVPYGVRDRLNEEIPPSRIADWLKVNIKTMSIGEVTLSKGVNVTVGLDAHALGVESIEMFSKIANNLSVACPLGSKHFKINVSRK